MSYIVLKFDDLNEKTLPDFLTIHDYCRKIEIPVCFGLIGNSLLNAPSMKYVSSLKVMKTQDVEIWNHGFCNTEEEFSKNYHDQQSDSIRNTQTLVEKYLGEAPTTFGSPHNNSTEMTVEILGKDFPEIDNYFFMADASGKSNAGQMVMRCNYEITTGVVDLDYFQKEYNRIKAYPYFVMQGHPSFWRAEDFENFKVILNILIKDGNEFLTAKQLAKKDISGFKHKLSENWQEDMAHFYTSHKNTVLYGAGEIGREVFRFMCLIGLRPEAFVVSDGQRTFTNICDVPVYYFVEARKYFGEFGIIPTLLSKNHDSVFGRDTFRDVDIWKPQNGTYDEFVDYVRYKVSVDSWK